MKINILISVSLFIAAHGFSQTTVQKKQVEQVRTNTKSSPILTSPAVQQNTATKTVNTTNNVLSSPVTKGTDSAKAALRDAFFTVTTAGSYNEDPGANKAADTHWSCVLFDANGRQIASFTDNSNTDEYISGSQTPVLKMHLDNSAIYSDLLKGGRIHISVTPSGNDTWEISEFDLSLDFSGPKFTNQLKWNGIRLTQDNKDIDLFFTQQNNGTLKYDIKANKKA